jgi:hypothetical protein
MDCDLAEFQTPKMLVDASHTPPGVEELMLYAIRMLALAACASL